MVSGWYTMHVKESTSDVSRISMVIKLYKKLEIAIGNPNIHNATQSVGFRRQKQQNSNKQKSFDVIWFNVMLLHQRKQSILCYTCKRHIKQSCNILWEQ